VASWLVACKRIVGLNSNFLNSKINPQHYHKGDSETYSHKYKTWTKLLYSFMIVLDVFWHYYLGSGPSVLWVRLLTSLVSGPKNKLHFVRLRALFSFIPLFFLPSLFLSIFAFGALTYILNSRSQNWDLFSISQSTLVHFCPFLFSSLLTCSVVFPEISFIY